MSSSPIEESSYMDDKFIEKVEAKLQEYAKRLKEQKSSIDDSASSSDNSNADDGEKGIIAVREVSL